MVFLFCNIVAISILASLLVLLVRNKRRVNNIAYKIFFVFLAVITGTLVFIAQFAIIIIKIYPDLIESIRSMG